MQITEESFAEASSDWDELALRLAVPPFLKPRWFEIWWRAFGKGRLRVITARANDGSLAAALPVVHRVGVTSSPTNWHTPLYGPVTETDVAAEAIYEQLLRQQPRRLDLAFIDTESPGIEILLDSPRSHRQTGLESPYLPVDGAWEDYWGSRSKNLRGTVRRCRNRLSDLGEVELQIVDASDDLDARLAEGFELEHSGWKEAGGTSVLAQPDAHRFYSDLAQWAASEGFLRLAFLRIDGRAVAFNYCLEQHGVHYLMKLGHDYELHRFGPGTVLTADMIERAFREGLASYEFLGGPDRYKLRWTNLCRQRLRLQTFAPTPAGMVDRMIQVPVKRLVKRVLRR